jgi:hypothetical protein
LTLENPVLGARRLAAALPAEFDEPALSLPLPASQVTGTLLQEGRPVPHAEVSLVALRDGSAVAWGTTRGDGSFTTAFLPAGAYSLTVDGRPVRTVNVEGSAIDLGSVPLEGGASSAGTDTEVGAPQP